MKTSLFFQTAIKYPTRKKVHKTGRNSADRKGRSIVIGQGAFAMKTKKTRRSMSRKATNKGGGIDFHPGGRKKEPERMRERQVANTIGGAEPLATNPEQVWKKDVGEGKNRNSERVGRRSRGRKKTEQRRNISRFLNVRTRLESMSKKKIDIKMRRCHAVRAKKRNNQKGASLFNWQSRSEKSVSLGEERIRQEDFVVTRAGRKVLEKRGRICFGERTAKT